MILTKEQARAVYDAMCALQKVSDNTSGNITLYSGTDARGTISAYWDNDAVAVERGALIRNAREDYDGLAMFHLAYDL